MRRFKYKAQTYLKVVKNRRDEALVVVKDAEKRCNLIKDRILHMEEQLSKARKFNSEFGSHHQNIHVINDNNSFINRLKVQSQALDSELKQAEEVYRDKFEKLKELQVQLKSLEKHKEKKKAEFDQENKRKQQKIYDELNSTQHGAKDARSTS